VLVLGLPHLTVLSAGELQMIVAHELVHVSRGDTSLGVFSYRFLESLRLSIRRMQRHAWRWFNPLYALAAGYFRLFLYLSVPIRRFQELRCDAVSAAAFGGELAAATLLKEWLLAHQFEMLVAGRCPEFSPSGLTVNSGETVYDTFARRWQGL